MVHLLDAIREVMNDPMLSADYPDGVTAADVLTEIREKHHGAFPLCTWLDVHDEMTKFYGRPK